LKIVFLSQYLFIAILSRVNKALVLHFWLPQF